MVGSDHNYLPVDTWVDCSCGVVELRLLGSLLERHNLVTND